MQPLAAWVNGPQYLVRFRPGIKVSCITDSIGVPQAPGGWQQEVINHCQMMYGANAPTWITHGIAGVNIETATSNGQTAAAIADNPDIILIQLGVNDIFNVTHSLPAPTPSYIAGVAATMITTIRASLPNVPIGWILPLVSGGEQWNPPASAVPPATVSDIALGISQACAANGAQVIDLHSLFMANEQILNPSQQAFGILTFEGTHPNWRGRPLMGRGIVTNVYFDNTTGVNVDLTPGWTPDTDVTPSVWIEADACAPGPVSSVGNGTAWTTFAGATSPTCVAGAWFNGKSALRFNGTTDVMTSSLSTGAGAKTIFAVYKISVSPPGFGTWYSLLNLSNGSGLTTEFAPLANSSWSLTLMMADQHAGGGDGFLVLGTSDINYSTDGSFGFPIRYSARWAGGTSTDTSKYTYQWGGAPLGVLSSSGLISQTVSALPALGARIADGITPTEYFAGDLAALLVYPASLTTAQWGRVDQYLRRKWGP